MNQKIKKAYTKVKTEITEHPAPYAYVLGVVAGAVSYHVGMTWKQDLLALPHNRQKTLLDGSIDYVTYMTKSGTFHVLPARMFNK